MARKASKEWMLIETFAQVWSQHYHGEVYEKSGKDFRFAKEYLEINDGEFVPDNIVAKAQVYLGRNGFYAENRHGFAAFVNNIGSFVPERGKIIEAPKTGRTHCGVCNQMIPDHRFLDHAASCKIKQVTE